MKNREKENMEILYTTIGGDITALRESNIPGKKNPDYFWRGHMWEEQETISHSKNAIDKNTQEGIHQIYDDPGGLVIDIGDNNMPLSDVHIIILNRMRRSANFICDIILIKNKVIVDICRYKK